MAVPEPAARPWPARRAPTSRDRKRAAAAVLLTPFFVLFAAAMLAPIGYAIWLSLFRTHRSGLGFGGTSTVFSGLANYTSVLGDPAFRSGFVHVALYAVLFVPVMLASALAVAMLLDSALARAKRFFQLTLFLPHVVPGVIAALVWAYLYTPNISPVVRVLQSVGVPFNLSSVTTDLPGMANIGLWEVLGYNVVIFYAALQAIPGEVLEAAVVDGASEARVAWSVKLPMIRTSLGLVGLFTGVGVLQLFNEPWMMSQNGAAAITSKWVPNMYTYTEAFQNADYGRAAAGSLLIALVSGLLSFAVTRISNPWSRA
ncbi:carbohydrate ABC transporter permease [Actinacidiphila sp. bgisy144]|uniref:carbohydrate ABC transporter permease n=1 Tax=unclassified Actinacidiphila TaxID=2995708 RepID=UPI003EC13F4D